MTTPREAVERAGIDVNALIGLLSSAARAELSSVYRYTVLAAHSIGFADEGLREILRDIRAENRHHFDALVMRIHELGGSLPEQIRPFLGDGDERQDDVFAGPADPAEALIESVQQAVRTYAGLRDLTEGKDQRTAALVQAIQNEKSEHVAWLGEFFGRGPRGRFRRGFRGGSPLLARLPDTEEGTQPPA
ncbi:ferritin-like domain-containing protein [Nonomuraea basaltis]|uniref:ferritin-like domain-containing protein n=1 Tax=Nonomuraea basaltis TaxID=2495887 RepID=UPI00110C574C|nr:ferritin-like domain-containing protein [Nonomuraea basaltis]TMR88620.1 DNA protection protein DPS [Nonomuraea basaltis]